MNDRTMCSQKQRVAMWATGTAITLVFVAGYTRVAYNTLASAAENTKARQPPPAGDARPAPTGFGEFQLGMTRRELQTLLAKWELRERHRSRGPLVGTFHALPNRKPYLGLSGLLPVFADGNVLDAAGRTAHASPLTTIHLEFAEQARADLPTFLRALEEKYGAPLRQGWREACLFDIVPWSDRPIEAILAGRFGKENENAGRLWEWPETDLRLTALIAVYEKTFLTSLSFERGVLSRERAEAQATEDAKRRADEELRARNRQALDSLRDERAAPLPEARRGKIRILDCEVETASVVFALGKWDYKGHPSFEIRDAVRVSIERLPDGVLFQTVTSNGGGPADKDEVPPGGLLVASQETRQQALDYLSGLTRRETGYVPNYSYVALGQSAASFSRAVKLQPEVIFMVTNDRRPWDNWMDNARKLLPNATKVHVLCWSFPGDFEMHSPIRDSHTVWQDIATESGGSFSWVASTSGDYFWGRGPAVQLRQGSGRIVYADDYDMLVLKDKVGRFDAPTERYSKNRRVIGNIGDLHIRSPIPRESVPENQRRFLPPGSFAESTTVSRRERPKQ